MGLLTPLAIRIGAIPWMPKLLPQVVWLDRNLHRVSGGRVTVLDIAGLPNLMLTVIGRKSGQPRSTTLLAVPRGESWLIAGSNFGGPKQPVWVVNIEANTDCQITVKGKTRDMRARRLEGEERDEAWEFMIGTWPNYRLYEQRTETQRRIKVFELTPR